MLIEKKVEEKRTSKTILFGKEKLTIEDVNAIAHNDADVCLSDDESFYEKVTSGAEFLERLLKEDGVIYGVTTGYGDSCTVQVPLDKVDELPLHLTRFHGCGLGEFFNELEGRAILAVRLASLSQGVSGVRWRMLRQFETLLNKNIVPVIPKEGSVGASGDLTPLSYVAATLIGERDVYFEKEKRATAEVFEELDITPLKLKPKEGLAVMNGTAVMTALACLAYSRAEYLTRLCTRITSLCSLALKGNSNHFDDILFSVKPHPGQGQIATWIREDLHHDHHPRNSSRLQDRYSIRCAPHVIGVLRDSLPWMRQMIEIELNSANDNPIIDGAGEHVLHGGHFYGGHIAFVMDSLKNCVANLADLMDRQMALLVDNKFNNGLPNNLSAAVSDRKPLNHGFKAVQIAVSAWTAEALKNTMPASVFSRSTECHNQDKVSMGTIAARDCVRVLELTEQIASALLMASTQGLELRMRQNELEKSSLSDSILQTHNEVFEHFEILTEDRPLDKELRKFVDLIQLQVWSTY
ncbi:HAL/PAL/TAL family ammonia-lyase [Aliikangiella coralliicola]|uniref:tyrosine ammonia-lyase n=1 Tax=Aliikangiella coralliicola TaxID=2592383 RepID=A0A545UEF2_9GAMM|nr:aromatic amino acid ammonia-lyase [Aliikangiella coralliicola]TQV87859.1 aromatic amino acid lyase [Aliikangiella coralliicola]